MKLRLTGQYIGGTIIGLGWGAALGFLIAKYTHWGDSSPWAVVFSALALTLVGQYFVWKAQKTSANRDQGDHYGNG